MPSTNPCTIACVMALCPHDMQLSSCTVHSEVASGCSNRVLCFCDAAKQSPTVVRCLGSKYDACMLQSSLAEV